MRSLAFFAVIGSMALLSSGSAGALPAASVEGVAAIESNMLLVRDGCGRGMRFSNRLQACVEDFDRGPPRYYGERDYYRGPPPRVIIPQCPRGNVSATVGRPAFGYDVIS
jgi:hypothetical protein